MHAHREWGFHLRTAEPTEDAHASFRPVGDRHLERGVVGVRDEHQRALRHPADKARVDLSVSVGRRRDVEPRELGADRRERGELVVRRGRGRPDASQDLERGVEIG